MIRQRKKRSRITPVKRNPQLYSRTELVKTEKRGGFLKYFIFLFIIGISYLFLFSPIFKIDKIIVSGDAASKSTVESKAKKIVNSNFLKNNILLLNTGSLERSLEEDKSIKSSKITKKYAAKSVLIDIKTEKPMAIWSNKGKKYLLNESGKIYKEVGEKEEGDSKLIKINYKLPDGFELGQKVLSENTFDFTRLIVKNFELKVSEKISSIDFENSQNEVTVYTASYKVFLDTKRDALGQLDKISLVKKEAENKVRNLDYIDLRIESRVFYKLRW